MSPMPLLMPAPEIMGEYSFRDVFRGRPRRSAFDLVI
jgi:hypothetical protein